MIVKQNKDRSGIQVIARAATILRVLEKEREGLNTGELAKKVSLPRSTVQRIVAALAEEHMVISTGPNSRITLGPAIMRMAANSDFDFTKVVRPYLEVLAQKTGETVDLSILSGDKMVFVDQIDANHRLSAVSAIGSDFPAFSSANGKAALSLLEDDSILALLKKGLFKETKNTLENTNELLSEIQRIRISKIAFDDQEHTEGISAAGTAFHDPLGRIFAISVPVPTIRFVRSREVITDALLHLRSELLGSMQMQPQATQTRKAV